MRIVSVDSIEYLVLRLRDCAFAGEVYINGELYAIILERENVTQDKDHRLPRQ